MTGAALVIGYGNVLRMDDGIGWHIAERLADDPRLAGVTVLGRHQLTPELALDISAAGFVVLVDARIGPPAGSFGVERVEPLGRHAAPMTHNLGPAGLVDLAIELYDRAPDVFVVSVGVESVEAGDRLTPIVEAAVPAVIEAIIELIQRRPDAGQPGLAAGLVHA